MIQKITLSTSLWETGKAQPIRKVETQVEGFFLRNGTTDLDLQTFKEAFDPAKVDKVQIDVNLEIGIGTYNGAGVTDFKILEAKHAGAVKGKIAWTSQTKFIDLRMVVNKDGSITTFTGPWGGVE